MNRLALFVVGLLFVFSAAGCADTSTMQANNGWVTLIDGTNGLDNWTRLGYANWRPEEGAIQADQPNNNVSGYLVSKNAYGNFKLHAEFWVSGNAKSGIFFRCNNAQTITSKTCYETQIFDHRTDEYGTGALVNVGPVSQPFKVGGHWNTYDITAKGSHLTVVLNGVRTVDVENANLARGLIVLQYRGGLVKYRKLQVQPL